MPSVRVGDINVYYELHGDGPPLVFIGGLGTDLTLFAPMTRQLAQHFRVLTFDNRGAGRTDQPDTPYSIPMMAQDTVALMDTLGVSRAHIIGMSMGGRIAIEIAGRHPERVDRLVLISSAATGTGSLHISLPARLMRTAKRLRLLPRAAHPQADHAYRHQLTASTSYDGADLLPKITAPTLLLHGRNDRSMPLAAAQATQSGIRDALLEVFDGGHMFALLSQRTTVLEHIEAFLSDHVH
ncbi:MAG TPA: alpha/beta hydrolase [Actinocrinis sp.]|jgi:pimeloyl-ACP methyl ester carboxylesterase|uniref:alpha/beta fold hydrolase n=1 Tax=Actinocrinis sp. TaxID=1920516 RepID=UPI002DDD51A1|nr:alpha/beta hydrolase [Actinocrinis sp.]HEV3169715.1 alpha/beta hydrolase [Actinocrinis sp.]